MGWSTVGPEGFTEPPDPVRLAKASSGSADSADQAARPLEGASGSTLSSLDERLNHAWSSDEVDGERTAHLPTAEPPEAAEKKQKSCDRRYDDDYE